ncbi:hypothetical protein CAE01nite_22930 [Cellulomonas aerilata]|uniref:Glycosyltransferase RgtA/B/C/D-like domain-containing protein n=1 Tax=Cellulomonas aerilata TaxID=515326 RepID=A0A512DDL3_9CELL|nr:hypothetical protein CAE01nite_22930 [Cellulomonas aerilata]
MFPWKPVLGVFALMTALLSTVVAFASRTVTRTDPVLQGPAWLDGWFQYDAGWYHAIATSGYFYVPGQQSSIAFFPTYPLTVRGLGGLLDDYQVAGSVIGVASGAASVLLFGAWVWRRLPRRSAVTAIAVLMLYPYAFFLYGAMYADSLFVLTAIGAFLLLERRLYWLAGLVGALATAGRPVGVAVAVGLVVRALELRALDRADRATPAAAEARVAAPGGGPTTSQPHGSGSGSGSARAAAPGWPAWRELVSAVRLVRWREAGVLVSGLGLLAWTVFLWLEFGNPLAFVEVESAPGWNQGVGPRTWFKITFLGTLVKGPYSVALLLTLQALACLAAVLLLRRVWRRFGWGYLAYSVVVLAIPIVGTKDFMGTGRYVLAAFPVMAAAGDLLATTEHRWLRPAALLLCGVLLVVLTTLFGRGVAVS